MQENRHLVPALPASSEGLSRSGLTSGPSCRGIRSRPEGLAADLNLGLVGSAVDVLVDGPGQAFARVALSKLREIDAHLQAFKHDPRAGLYLLVDQALSSQRVRPHQTSCRGQRKATAPIGRIFSSHFTDWPVFSDSNIQIPNPLFLSRLATYTTQLPTLVVLASK
jgi:hypothetical protein